MVKFARPGSGSWVPPQGAPGGYLHVQLGTPRKRPANWAPSHSGCIAASEAADFTTIDHVQIDLGAMRFPDIDIMKRVGASPNPASWSLVGKVSLWILANGSHRTVTRKRLIWSNGPTPKPNPTYS